MFVQQEVGETGQTAIEFPPMQKGASFNLEAVKAKIEAAQAAMAKQDVLFAGGSCGRPLTTGSGSEHA